VNHPTASLWWGKGWPTSTKRQEPCPFAIKSHPEKLVHRAGKKTVAERGIFLECIAYIFRMFCVYLGAGRAVLVSGFLFPPLTNRGGKLTSNIAKVLILQGVKKDIATGRNNCMFYRMEKEMTVKELAAKAGRAGRGQCKNRSAQMRAYWRKVKSGKIKHRGRGPSKPKQIEIPFNEGAGNESA
jgi:hypothetical protein